MATVVLPIEATVGASAEFTLTGNTLVWVHGANGDDVLLGLDIMGSDGKFSGIADMTARGDSGGIVPVSEARPLHAPTQGVSISQGASSQPGSSRNSARLSASQNR